MGYREEWFKHNEPNMFGKYRCVGCGGYFTKDKIEIDHRIPKKLGGTDHLSNLAPMCRSCNRSKRANVTNREVVGTLVRSAVSGNLGDTLGSMVKQQTKNSVNKGLEGVLGKKAGKAVSRAIGINYKR